MNAITLARKEPRNDAAMAHEGPNNAWIVVITKASNEKTVRERLIHAGFEVYLPMRLVEANSKGRLSARGKASVPVPFFPRHLFARASLDAARWQVIFTTVGIQRVLCDPRRPMGVTDAFVQALRSREIDGLFRIGLVGADEAHWKPGQKITTLNGLLDAFVTEVVDGRRATLLASVFNSDSFRITVDLRKLAARS